MAKLAERKVELRRTESGKVEKKKMLKRIGIIVYIIGMYSWFTVTFRDIYFPQSVGYFFSTVVVVAGLVIVYRATRFNILIDMYNNYYYWIYQNEIFTLEEISRKSNKSEQKVIQEIDALIEEGLLKNIHIDLKEKTIEGAFVTSIKEQILRKVVRCRGCGARNEVVENETRECEYCGRKLIYENEVR